MYVHANMKTRCELRYNQSDSNAHCTAVIGAIVKHDLLSISSPGSSPAGLSSGSSFDCSAWGGVGIAALPLASLASLALVKEKSRGAWNWEGMQAQFTLFIPPIHRATVPQHTYLLYFLSIFYRLLQNNQHRAQGAGRWGVGVCILSGQQRVCVPLHLFAIFSCLTQFVFFQHV